MELRRLRDTSPYPNYYDDPDQISDEGPKARQTAHIKLLRASSNEIYVVIKRTHVKREHLWEMFISSFRPHKIRSWTWRNLIEWVELLTSRGIHLHNDRSRSPIEAIIDILYRNSRVSCKITG